MVWDGFYDDPEWETIDTICNQITGFHLRSSCSYPEDPKRRCYTCNHPPIEPEQHLYRVVPERYRSYNVGVWCGGVDL